MSKQQAKPVQLYTLICKEEHGTIVIPNLTWQQALIEKSRKLWEYADAGKDTSLDNISIVE